MVDYELLAKELTKFLKAHKLFLGKIDGPPEYNDIRGFTPMGQREIVIREVPLRKDNRDIEYCGVTPTELDDTLKKELHFDNGDLHFAVRVFPKYAREEVRVQELGNTSNGFEMLGNPRIYFRIFLYKQQ